MEHVPDPIFMSAETIEKTRQWSVCLCEEIETTARQQRDYYLSLLPAHTGDMVVSEQPLAKQGDAAVRAAHIKAIDLSMDIYWAVKRQEAATLKLLPHYSDYDDKLPKKATSRLSVAPVPETEEQAAKMDGKEEGSMWMLYSEGVTAKPLNKFAVHDVLRWIKKQPGIDWGVLVTPEDRQVLDKYGFDKEGLRRVRNRMFLPIYGNKTLKYAEPLDVIAGLLPPAIAAQVDFAALEKRFLGRWLLRMQKAKEEELYKTSAPHKRRLEELEQEAHQLREKRPRLFD